jgi:hypothetical protein
MIQSELQPQRSLPTVVSVWDATVYAHPADLAHRRPPSGITPTVGLPGGIPRVEAPYRDACS